MPCSMHIEFIEIQNYRRLESVRVDFGEEETIFVGANNSGKSSAIRALQTFLVSSGNLSVRDIIISNWPKINAVGEQWSRPAENSGVPEEPISLNSLLPQLDVWIHAERADLHSVYKIIPNLDWEKGRIGIRFAYEVKDLKALVAEYTERRSDSRKLCAQARKGSSSDLAVWPMSLKDFLLRRLASHVQLVAYHLDAAKIKGPDHSGIAQPQELTPDHQAFDVANPLEGLIKIDEIVAQRDFTDAGTNPRAESHHAKFGRTLKGKLSSQLRDYFDKHLDPTVNPDAEDVEALAAVHAAEQSFNDRLKEGFTDAFEELSVLGYPGLGSPKLRVSAELKTTNDLQGARRVG